MITVTDILDKSAVNYEPFDQVGGLPVFLTAGNQLIAAYKFFEAVKQSVKGYRGWHAHHVFETQDLERMHVTTIAPVRDDQLCVLLPERAHIGRINSVLRRQAPKGAVLSPRALLDAYKEAYDLMGDYCGGGELIVRRELVSLVEGTLKAYRLM